MGFVLILLFSFYITRGFIRDDDEFTFGLLDLSMIQKPDLIIAIGNIRTKESKCIKRSINAIMVLLAFI